jgi:hypothetical protein
MPIFLLLVMNTLLATPAHALCWPTNPEDGINSTDDDCDGSRLVRRDYECGFSDGSACNADFVGYNVTVVDGVVETNLPGGGVTWWLRSLSPPAS